MTRNKSPSNIRKITLNLEALLLSLIAGRTKNMLALQSEVIDPKMAKTEISNDGKHVSDMIGFYLNREVKFPVNCFYDLLFSYFMRR